MDRLLAACDEVGNVLQLKFSSGVAGGAESLPDGVTPEMEKEWLKANGAKAVIKPPRWGLREVIANGVQDVKHPLR
jgi:serine palmitoyltransferase